MIKGKAVIYNSIYYFECSC